MAVKMILTGDERLNARLAELKLTESKKIITKAARIALRPTLAAARRNSPVRAGNLRKSISIRSLPRSRARVGARVVTSKSNNLFTGKTFYGAFQEFGWKTGARRRTVDHNVRRHIRRLRSESRRARNNGDGKGLAKLGTGFRERQEAYFRAEANRLAKRDKVPNRRQVDGLHFMETALRSTEASALEIYGYEIMQGLEQFAKAST